MKKIYRVSFVENGELHTIVVDGETQEVKSFDGNSVIGPVSLTLNINDFKSVERIS